MVRRATGMEANLVVRGVGPDASGLRGAFRIVEGRNFEPGKAELIAGRGAAREFAGVALGSVVRVREQQWTVVGIFEAGGSAYESEFWVDLPVAASAFRREGSVNSMRLRMDAAGRKVIGKAAQPGEVSILAKWRRPPGAVGIGRHCPWVIGS